MDLTEGVYLPLKLEYFESTGDAFIHLTYSVTEGQACGGTPLPSEWFYRKREHTPISGSSRNIYSRYQPRQPTGLYQSDDSTYHQTQITLHWAPPVDNGCDAITKYTIYANVGGEWIEVGT